MVVAGTTDDEPLVAARVSARGVGRDLATQGPTPERSRRAVPDVPHDGAVHAAFDRLAAEHADHDPVARIEHLLG